MMLSVLLHGFTVGSGLIIAIGPQNTFVITQGIKREHVFLTAFMCLLTDTLLIGLGVIGLGALFHLHPLFTEIARWLGALFLLSYSFLAFKAAIHPGVLRINSSEKNRKNSMKNIVFILLGLGLLNPHAYLDAVVLIGSLAAQNPGSLKYYFGLGSIFASACWFFGIAYGARTLAPIFAKPQAWRILDFVVGISMLSMALILVF